jgi:predicted KAP-like P-loop ATPase
MHSIQEQLRGALEHKPRIADLTAQRTRARSQVRSINKLKIVVFIDELDRCPLEHRVILEAIKLFLAEDIFIVLIAIDTRVAAEAIRLHYGAIKNPELPREYLEKIVQIPLRVPTAGNSEITTYLNGLMSVAATAPATGAVIRQAQDGTSASIAGASST